MRACNQQRHKPSLEQSLYKHCDIVKKIKVRDVYSYLGIIR